MRRHSNESEPNSASSDPLLFVRLMLYLSNASITFTIITTMVASLRLALSALLGLVIVSSLEGFGSVVLSRSSSRKVVATVTTNPHNQNNKAGTYFVSVRGGASSKSSSSTSVGATMTDSPSSSTSDERIIPREILFGNPKYTSPKLSPDGEYISFLAPSEDLNVLNVFVKRTTEPLEQARMITNDKSRGIRNAFWAEDSKTILYMQDFEVSDAGSLVFRQKDSFSVLVLSHACSKDDTNLFLAWNVIVSKSPRFCFLELDSIKNRLIFVSFAGYLSCCPYVIRYFFAG